MAILPFIIGLKTGVLLTIFILWFKNKRRKKTLTEEKNNLLNQVNTLTIDINIAQEKTNNYKSQLSSLCSEIEKERELVFQLQKQVAISEADFKICNEKLMEQKTEFNAMQEKFQVNFKNFVSNFLDDKMQKFMDQNNTNLKEILKNFQ